MDDQEFPPRSSQPPPTEPTGEVTEFGQFRLSKDQSELWKDGALVQLHTQEARLLWYLAANPGRILDRDEILQQVWGYGTGTTTRTVDVHIAKLRHRLGESESPRHILTARGRGYRFQP